MVSLESFFTVNNKIQKLIIMISLDRILTKELTPGNLTNWGYQYTRGDPKSNNRIFPSLLSNLFPEVSPDSADAFTADELKTLFNTPKKTTK